MNVVYVYQGQWPKNAVRIAKETRSLARAGHRVTLASGNADGQRVRHGTDWMDVWPAPSRGAALRALANAPIPFNPMWRRHVLDVARSVGADRIVVRDLPLAPTAVRAGATLRIPVFFDMADVYPLWFASTRGDHKNPIKRWVRSPTLAARLERWVLRRIHGVFVVSVESMERCVDLGVPRSRVFMVGNTPETPMELREPQPLPEEIRDWKENPILLFIGNVLRDRGLDIAIDAMLAVRKRIPDVRLLIVGDGPELPALRRQVEDLGLDSHVRLLGWKPHETLPAYYGQATVGLLPFRATPHIRITLANKQFDYMAVGLPVVASDVPPMRRIIDETESGVTAVPEDPEALAEAIISLCLDPQRASDLGRNGQAAVDRKYNWGVDGARFVEAVERGAVAR